MSKMKQYHDFCIKRVAELQATRDGLLKDRQAITDQIVDITHVMVGMEAEIERLQPLVAPEIAEEEAARAMARDMATSLAPTQQEEKAA